MGLLVLKEQRNDEGECPLAGRLKEGATPDQEREFHGTRFFFPTRRKKLLSMKRRFTKEHLFCDIRLHHAILVSTSLRSLGIKGGNSPPANR